MMQEKKGEPLFLLSRRCQRRKLELKPKKDEPSPVSVVIRSVVGPCGRVIKDSTKVGGWLVIKGWPEASVEYHAPLRRPKVCIQCSQTNGGHYLRCLEVAAENNWQGWTIAKDRPLDGGKECYAPTVQQPKSL